MGPRSLDRGNHVALRSEFQRLLNTSMGPRSLDRGNDSTLAARLDFMGLQWGRDLSIAEMLGLPPNARKALLASMGPRSLDRGNTPPPGMKFTLWAMLQWGRDLSIAEMLAPCVHADAEVKLQWGRDLSIAEIEVWNDDPDRTFEASMGPRSLDRGNAGAVTVGDA